MTDIINPQEPNTATLQLKQTVPVSSSSQTGEERAFLAAIVQSSEDAIIGKDLNGIITSWNPTAQKMFGYTPQEAIGKPMTLIYPQEKLGEFVDIINKVKQGIPVERYETQRKAKNGNIVDVSVVISPVRDENNTIVGISAIDRDITGQRQAQTQSLSLAAIVQSSEDAIISESLDGIIRSWNFAAEKIFGYKANEVIGRPMTLIGPDDRGGEFEEYIRKVKNGEPVERYETKRKRKDGSFVDVSVSISPIKDELNEIVGISAIDRDITGQKQSAQYARSLIEASLDPLVTINPEGKITDVNEASIKVTGVEREKLIGTDFSNYFTEPEKAQEGYQTVLKESEVRDYPLTIRNVDNVTFTDVLYNASVYKDDKGNVLGVFAAARDITDTKKASQYARSLIEASLDPLVTISPEGKVTDVNEATIDVTGVPRESLIGSDFTSYFTDPEEARQGYQQVFKEGFVRDYPLTIRGSSGLLTDVLYNASVYKDDKGNVLGVFAAARDTTARKKAEEQLHETSAYARSLIESSLDPLVTISPEGKITDVNHATEEVTGVSREWLIGTDFTTYFTEPHKARDGYRMVLKEGKVRDYPLAIRHSSGKITDVLYNASVYKDALGKVRGIFAAARDVTETKKTSQYARSLIEASLDPLVTISPEGKITDVNEATVKVTGIPREKLIGTDFSNYFTEPQKAHDGYQQVFQKGFVTDYPLTIKSSNGNLTDVLYNASVYKDEKGNVLGVFAGARDYTRVKQNTDQVESANEELEAFSYSVSHDLRAPLRAIDGFAKMLEKDYGSKLGEEGKRLITVIEKNTLQMGKLIDDLLSFSRLGRNQINREYVKMKEMARQVLDEQKALVPQRTIEYILHDLPDVRVDPDMIRVVWTNLFSNAIKFTGKKEKAVIEVNSQIDDNTSSIIYSVKDNGAGFDMQYVEKLFGVFQRLHSIDEFEGTGVGLANVKRVIERFDGKVWAEGKVGEGATFYFSLPKI